MKACEKATYLKEKSNLAKLSFWERFKMKLHLMMCSDCSKYSKDSDTLNRVFKNCGEDQKFSDEKKSELKRKLQNN